MRIPQTIGRRWKRANQKKQGDQDKGRRYPHSESISIKGRNRMAHQWGARIPILNGTVEEHEHRMGALCVSLENQHPIRMGGMIK